MSQNIRLSSIVDFYYLEILEASVPTNQFNKAAAKLKSDVQKARHDLEEKLARAIRDYCYIAAFCEARHAAAFSRLQIDILENGSRDSVCNKALKYKPEEVLPSLIELFEEGDWDSAYGGQAWADIARVATVYNQTDSLAFFIDHVIDVYHNGGSLFDKHTAGNYARLHLDASRSTIIDFLDYRANCENILTDFVDLEDDSDTWKKPVTKSMYKWINNSLSSKTSTLIFRFFNIIKNPEGYSPHLDSSANGWFDCENTVYQNQPWQGSIVESEPQGFCESCGNGFPEDSLEWIENNLVCEECKNEDYGYCDGCYDHKSHDVLTYVDSAKQTVCDDCLEADFVQCDDCLEWFEDIHTKTKNENVYCESCFENLPQPCSVCGRDTEYINEVECKEKHGNAPCKYCLYRQNENTVCDVCAAWIELKNHQPSIPVLDFESMKTKMQDLGIVQFKLGFDNPKIRAKFYQCGKCHAALPHDNSTCLNCGGAAIEIENARFEFQPNFLWI